MQKKLAKEKCNGCHSCYNVCPKQAITMVEDEKGFKHPQINKEKCINCNLCVKVCPIIHKLEGNVFLRKAYACINKNETERKKSSSGGIFVLLAKEIIKNNGVVYGACLNNEFKVVHQRITSEKEIEKLMGSKYVQSEIGENFKAVQKDLKKGYQVLFTGTPCQIEGLKAFLRKEYDNLYTQDIICHGVPSPLVWEKYKRYRKEIDHEIPQEISFRNKDEGWHLYNMKFSYKSGAYKQIQKEDLFMKAFLKNTILRNSCYNCNVKKINRVSDITLGDYWGIEKFFEQMDDNKGVSAVIIQSQKGMELFDKIKENLIFEKTTIDDIVKYNPSLNKSVDCDPNREKFFENMNKISFDELVRKYTYKPTIIKRVIRKIKKIIKLIIK